MVAANAIHHGSCKNPKLSNLAGRRMDPVGEPSSAASGCYSAKNKSDWRAPSLPSLAEKYALNRAWTPQVHEPTAALWALLQ